MTRLECADWMIESSMTNDELENTLWFSWKSSNTTEDL